MNQIITLFYHKIDIISMCFFITMRLVLKIPGYINEHMFIQISVSY